MNWMRITEETKFPEADFLVCDASGECAVAAYWGYSPGREELKASGNVQSDYVVGGVEFVRKPTHWMPLPPPPEEA